MGRMVLRIIEMETYRMLALLGLPVARNYLSTLVQIEQKLTALRGQGAVKPLRLKATEAQIKKGAPASYEVPVTFDTSNFFV